VLGKTFKLVILQVNMLLEPSLEGRKAAVQCHVRLGFPRLLNGH
jgi:hypothetical protein